MVNWFNYTLVECNDKINDSYPLARCRWVILGMVMVWNESLWHDIESNNFYWILLFQINIYYLKT